ncbi:MAG TPA: redoxin domain-containing protein [Acidobacteriaceae bacterium]|nr:redoxin domain-containing protein [Acidobacteriaceae bacterium]
MNEANQEGRIQAEIAGGSAVSSHEVARKGMYLRGFELACLNGSLVRLAYYRDRSAVVLVLSDERPETERLLTEVAQHYEEIREKDAEILAIVHGSREQADAFKRTLHLPYPVLLDEDLTALRVRRNKRTEARCSCSLHHRSIWRDFRSVQDCGRSGPSGTQGDSAESGVHQL